MKDIKDILNLCRVLFYLLLTGSFANNFAFSREVQTEDLSNLSLEELTKIKVSTISRNDELIDKAPGNIYVFTRQIIQKRGYRSLGELLRVVPGFTVFHRDLQYVVGVRGLNANDNEKVSLLINGQVLNQVHEPDFLNGPINLDNIERVEVVVGPSSLFQQANTLAATINVITKEEDGTRILAASGNYLPYSFSVLGGKKYSADHGFHYSLTTEQKKGFDAWDSDFRPNISGTKQTGKLEQGYFGVFSGKFNEWYAQAVAYRTVLPELLINNADKQNDGQILDQFHSLYLQNEHDLTPKWKSVTSIATILKDLSRTNTNGIPDSGDQGLEQVIKQWNTRFESRFMYTGNEHQIQTGLQASYDNNYENYYTFHQSSPPENISKTKLINQDTYAIGVYADDTFSVSDKTTLVGGMRLDKNTRLQNSNWFHGARAAFITNVTDDWITKLMYHRAVRMPSPIFAPTNKAWGRDRPDPPPFARVSDNANMPERLSSVEFQNIVYLNKVRLGATVYHQELKDFISWLEPGTNVGDFRGTGVEINIQSQVMRILILWANASYNNSKLYTYEAESASPLEAHHVQVNREKRIIGAPKITANSGLDYEFVENVNFSPSIRYFTSQAAADFGENKFRTINDIYYIDAAITWKNISVGRDKEMDIRLSGQNLFDNRSPVAGQWLRDTYHPQGLSVVLAAELRL